MLPEELNAALAAFGIDVPGVKQVLYGVVMAATIMFMPAGVWPTIARRLGMSRRRRDKSEAGDA